jgi:transcriptional regulator GlxA family with amidase domain
MAATLNNRQGPRGPQRNSLLGRIVAFYQNNPDEELTYADMAVKFGVDERTVQSRVSDGVRAGYLERTYVVRLAAGPEVQHQGSQE